MEVVEEKNRGELDPSSRECVHLVSAFLAMEPTDWLISLARECGGGSISKRVQIFISRYCVNKNMCGKNAPSGFYVKKFLKKLIVELESSSDEVLDELYEQFADYMVAVKGDDSFVGSTRIFKRISFLFPSGFSEVSSSPRPVNMVVPLQCSVNMFEGDTGCSIWPSSLFLSEFILSYPEDFSGKSCFEVGSGVGLVGISLAYVKASKVVLTDGDLSTLANMKLNLELNQFNTETEQSQVQCKYLPWESASENELHSFRPDIVLGADVIYDPSCLPHLIRVLVNLLNPSKSSVSQSSGGYGDPSLKNGCLNGRKPSKGYASEKSDSDANCNGSGFGITRDRVDDSGQSQCHAVQEGPVAYLATVIRNMDTFHCFLRLAKQAHLYVEDVTENRKPLNLLPYMQSYDRSSIHLFNIKYL